MQADDRIVMEALEWATYIATLGPCAKSKRGVVIFKEDGIIGHDYNAPPKPFVCDGSEACRASCNKLCVHAESAALLYVGVEGAHGAHLLHVKVVDGKPVPSGPPSCWQCSREILAAGIATVWLLHEDGLRSYTAEEFHRLTLERCGLPVLRGDA